MKILSIEIKPLTRKIVEENIAALIEMSSQIRNDYWQLEHYLINMDKKWELSSVAFLEGAICGFIVVSAKPASLHVNRIVVAPWSLRSGVGKMLIEKAITDTRRQEMHFLTLKVDAANPGVIAFYKKWDFEQVGTQDDLLLMRLKVTA